MRDLACFAYDVIKLAGIVAIVVLGAWWLVVARSDCLTDHGFVFCLQALG